MNSISIILHCIIHLLSYVLKVELSIKLSVESLILIVGSMFESNWQIRFDSALKLSLTLHFWL